MVIRLYLILFASLCSQLLFSTTPNVVNFDRTQYEAANTNWSISEDSLGVMYFGNDIGLLEFDGMRWTLNKQKRDEVVRSVYAKGQTIYTGGYEEFGKWDRDISGMLKYTSLSDKLPQGTMHNDDIWTISEVNNTIYFQSFSAIYIYQDGKVSKLPSDKNFLLMMKVRNELWIQEAKGSLFRVVDRKLIKIPNSDFLSSTEVRVVLPFKSDKWLITTSTMDLYIYDGKTFTPLHADKKLILSDINRGIQVKDGTYYFGTIRGGIYQLDDNATIIDHFDAQSSMQNNTVLGLFQDRTGNIWASLDRGITCVRNLTDISCYIDPSGKTGSVYAAAIYDNKLFVGTNQGLFYTNDVNLVDTHSVSSLKFIPNTQGQVWVLKEIDGKLYCGHNRGLLVINHNLSITEPYNMDSGVFSILKQKNFLLLGTYTSFKTLNLKTNVLTDFGDSIQEPIIKIEVDHMNNVWVEHADKGVYKCRLNDSFDKMISHYYYGERENLPYRLCLFNVEGRVVLMGKDQFFTYDDIDNKIVVDRKLNACFANIKDLYAVDRIDDSHFWIIGDNLIYKLFYDGVTAKIEAHFDIGYHNLTLVNRFKKIVQLSDSSSLICMDNGFLLCKPINDHYLTSISKPYLKAIKLSTQNGLIKYLDKNLKGKVPNNYNTVTIQFSSQDAFAHNIAFQYKLEGLDDWSKLEHLNSVSYERLPKGKYVFHLRTVDRLGNISEPISYHFEVLPPWYQTLWASLGFVFLLLLILIMVWVLILRKYRNSHLRKIRLRETKRLRIQNKHLQIQVENKDAELLSQTSFIIQKNEFIFKVKNEIDSFYKQNDKVSKILQQKINVLFNDNLDLESDWKMFLIKFEQKHTDFFTKLKNSYPQLTANDLKLCACLKLNLDSKEIASLMNISVRAIENSRYRIRKKLNIPSTQNLNDFFINI